MCKCFHSLSALSSFIGDHGMGIHLKVEVHWLLLLMILTLHSKIVLISAFFFLKLNLLLLIHSMEQLITGAMKTNYDFVQFEITSL